MQKSDWGVQEHGHAAPSAFGVVLSFDRRSSPSSAFAARRGPPSALRVLPSPDFVKAILRIQSPAIKAIYSEIFEAFACGKWNLERTLFDVAISVQQPVGNDKRECCARKIMLVYTGSIVVVREVEL